MTILVINSQTTTNNCSNPLAPPNWCGTGDGFCFTCWELCQFMAENSINMNEGFLSSTSWSTGKISGIRHGGQPFSWQFSGNPMIRLVSPYPKHLKPRGFPQNGSSRNWKSAPSRHGRHRQVFDLHDRRSSRGPPPKRRCVSCARTSSSASLGFRHGEWLLDVTGWCQYGSYRIKCRRRYEGNDSTIWLSMWSVFDDNEQY